MPDRPDASTTALYSALLDYSRTPGKYQVGLRQPQLLFSQLREVLQMAAGREGETNTGSRHDWSSLRDAARFFVRTALLYPGADHYAVLGVGRKTDGAELKDRYRLLMRLLHPDFAGHGAGAWPSDAAVRVNLAYDTLSSAVQKREYDERLGPVKSAQTAQEVDARRVRPVAQATHAGDTRQSHFKKLAVACAVAGAALVIVSLFSTGSPDTGQLVQRRAVQPESVQIAMREPAEPPAVPVLTLQDTLAPPPPMHVPAPVKASGHRTLIAQPAAPAQKRVELVRPSVPLMERVIQMARAVEAAPAPSPAEPARQEPAPLPVAIAIPPPPTLPPVVATAANAPPAPAVLPQATPPRPAIKPGPTLVEAQPLLSQLLQMMESGRGERILSLLDAETRAKPSAQALSRHYDTLVDGARPVRVSHVELKSEPGDGRLLVVGYLRLLAGEQAIGALGKKMVLRAEFASREGTVVITGLSGGPVN